jgi:hypothetical protein
VRGVILLAHYAGRKLAEVTAPALVMIKSSTTVEAAVRLLPQDAREFALGAYAAETPLIYGRLLKAITDNAGDDFFEGYAMIGSFRTRSRTGVDPAADAAADVLNAKPFEAAGHIRDHERRLTALVHVATAYASHYNVADAEITPLLQQPGVDEADIAIILQGMKERLKNGR